MQFPSRGPKQPTYQVSPQATHRLQTYIKHPKTTQPKECHNKKLECCLVVPYFKGDSVRFSKICRCQGIQVHFKGRNTVCSMLVVTKMKTSSVQKSEVINMCKCTQGDFEREYIRESGRTFGERLKE